MNPNSSQFAQMKSQLVQIDERTAELGSMAVDPMLKHLAELARSAAAADAAALVIFCEPPVQIEVGPSIGTDQDWPSSLHHSAIHDVSNMPAWASSFLSVPITGPSAEEGFLAVARENGSFEDHMVESLSRIAALVEEALDRGAERVHIADLSEALRSNQEQLQSTRDQLASTNADLEQFAYIAAHELVSPLRSVSIYAEVLEGFVSQCSDTEQARMCAESIRKGVASMSQQVQYLLDFSRAQGMATDMETIDLTSVVSSALDTLAEPLEAADAVINLGDLPRIAGREVPLQSVFANLITNAVKYRHPDRRLEIDIRSDVKDGACRISIADNGVGIDDNDRARIFQLFERASTQPSGSGIGLALSRRIIEAHGGEIGIEEDTDEGSVFWLELPTPIA